MTETARDDAPRDESRDAHGEGPAAPGAPDAPASGLSVVLFPDPVLRRETLPITAFDEGLHATAAAMFECMYESRGVGLAAPQVGSSRRLFVCNPEGDRDQHEHGRAFVNPTITARAGKRVKHEEGCLSLPHIYAEIERPERCTVEYQDLDGARHVEELDGFIARIVQHEYDHLEGVLIVDRMTPADKARHRAALSELRDQYRAEAERPTRA